MRWCLLALAICLASGCGEESAPVAGPSAVAPRPERAPGPGSTPEETFAAARAAVARNDHAAFVACMTRDSQETFCGLILTGVRFAVRDRPDLQPELDEILARHSVESKPGPAAFAATKDLPAFLGELVEFAAGRLKKNPLDDSSGRDIGTLKSVEIDGDVATGTIAGAREESIEFRRVGGAWYIRFELP